MELLLKKDVTVYGDLYFNLTEAYFAVGETSKAPTLYQALNQNSVVCTISLLHPSSFFLFFQQHQQHQQPTTPTTPTISTTPTTPTTPTILTTTTTTTPTIPTTTITTTTTTITTTTTTTTMMFVASIIPIFTSNKMS
jgi:hypothetical protein